MLDGLSPLFWPIAELVASYRRGDLSPVDVAEEAIARIERFNPLLNAVLARLDDQARRQAMAAERAYRDGTPGPLGGVPVSVKDTFYLEGAVTTFGSALYRDHVADHDSGVVRRLRAAGAMFTGKANAAEFGQSGTTDNRLGDECRNPWDLTRTTGGSSGGAVASVAAGLANVAVGADGGGSIRIPAAFTGLFGLKPTFGLVADENGFRAMSDFIAAGPFAWRVADARVVLGVLAETGYPRQATPRGLRIAWCPRPEGRPVDPELAQVVRNAVDTLSGLGHEVSEVDLDLAGWREAFGPLVLAEEGRERGHLLATAADQLSDYERVSLEAARELTGQDIASARQRHDAYRQHMRGLFESFDVITTPTTAVPAFPVGERPETIAGQRVGKLWGAFPFTVPFNVSGQPAASIPCGFAASLPVGLQIVARDGNEGLLLDLAEDLEEALDFDRRAVQKQWSDEPSAARAVL